MNKDKINELINNNEEDMEYIKTLADKIVSDKTSQLDELMRDIQNDVVVNDNPGDDVIERYFLELTNAVYFINSKCEYLGFYEDVSKVKWKEKYNLAYVNNQALAVLNKTKVTVNDNQIYAEDSSIEENILNIVYARSFKVIRAKIDAAQEMIKTLSKILTKHIQEKDYSKFANVEEF